MVFVNPAGVGIGTLITVGMVVGALIKQPFCDVSKAYCSSGLLKISLDTALTHTLNILSLKVGFLKLKLDMPLPFDVLLRNIAKVFV